MASLDQAIFLQATSTSTIGSSDIHPVDVTTTGDVTAVEFQYFTQALIPLGFLIR